MRRQFVLDKRTDKLLENLATEGGGNRSMIVRAAIQHFPIWKRTSIRSKPTLASRK
jgi:hypothetical protein